MAMGVLYDYNYKDQCTSRCPLNKGDGLGVYDYTYKDECTARCPLNKGDGLGVYDTVDVWGGYEKIGNANISTEQKCVTRGGLGYLTGKAGKCVAKK